MPLDSTKALDDATDLILYDRSSEDLSVGRFDSLAEVGATGMETSPETCRTLEKFYHTGRYSFATMMLTLSADLYTTSKLLGLYNVKTTQIYAKIVDSKKVEAVNLVDGVFD